MTRRLLTLDVTRRWGRFVWGVAAGFALILTLASTALAQAPALPPSVEPGNIQRQFQAPIAPPEVAPSITVQSGGPQNAPPPGADQVKLTLDAVNVDGSTVYSSADFAALITPYLHHEISLVELFQLADAITTKYRADGYILSRGIVPAQSISATAHITVIEGFVSSVHFDGYDSPRLDAYGDQIKASKPLRASDLERYLLLANDLAGVQAKAVLAPSPDVAGAADLTIITEHRLADGSAALDNRGTKFIGPIQLYGAAGINIPGWDDRLAVRYITTPSIRELQYGAVTYTHPLGSDGLRFRVDGNATTSHPGYTLEPFYIHSDGDELAFTLEYPLWRGRDRNLEFYGRFDVRDLVTVVNHVPNLPPSSDDHLRVLRLGLAHDIADVWGGLNTLGVELSRGLNILGASANDMRATPSRVGAQSDFTTWRGEISRHQDFGTFFSALSGVGLLLSAEGQLSESGALPASEQFSLGGTQYGRAYDSADVIGDNGWGAKSELQYSPPVPDFAAAYVNSYQFYTFYERGRVSRNISSIGKPSLSDAGIGIRLQVADRFNADFQLAKPLSRDESINYGQYHARPWRFFTSLQAQF